jgi:hypothetical protein
MAGTPSAAWAAAETTVVATAVPITMVRTMNLPCTRPPRRRLEWTIRILNRPADAGNSCPSAARGFRSSSRLGG